jgi:hypothetical protein
MADLIYTVKVDLLNELPFLDLIQRAIDLRNVAERSADPLLRETVRQFDAWFEESRDR